MIKITAASIERLYMCNVCEAVFTTGPTCPNGHAVEDMGWQESVATSKDIIDTEANGTH